MWETATIVKHWHQTARWYTEPWQFSCPSKYLQIHSGIFCICQGSSVKGSVISSNQALTNRRIAINKIMIMLCSIQSDQTPGRYFSWQNAHPSKSSPTSNLSIDQMGRILKLMCWGHPTVNFLRKKGFQVSARLSSPGGLPGLRNRCGMVPGLLGTALEVQRGSGIRLWSIPPPHHGHEAI